MANTKHNSQKTRFTQKTLVKKFEKEVVKLYEKIATKNTDLLQEISIFGSRSSNNYTHTSDLDVIILHKAKVLEDYLILDSLISSIKNINNDVLIDVFFSHERTFKFIYKYLNPYLSESFQSRRTIVGINPGKVFKKTKRNLSILHAHCALLKGELDAKLPTILHQERNKNLKKIIWFFKFLSQINPKYISTYKKLILRKSSIKKELPVDTITADTKILEKIMASYQQINKPILNYNTYLFIKIAKFYFIDLKRYRIFKEEKDKNHMIGSKGLKLLFQFIVTQKVELTAAQEDFIQNLTDIFINKSFNCDLTKSYYLLMMNIDNIFKYENKKI